MPDRDLFGPVPEGARIGPKRGPKGGKHYVRPNGYAGIPGTGPDGKRCMDCDHYCRHQGGANTYPKCRLRKATWTAGRASDILARSPACSRFQETPMTIPATEQTPVTTGRATTAQREFLTRLLTEAEYISGPMQRNARTGRTWQLLFTEAGTPAPAYNNDSIKEDWPTVGAWMDSLTKQGASRVIAQLQNELED